MSVEFLNALSVFFVLLLLGSIALSAYLLYDIKSGNYRKLLSAGKGHEGLVEDSHEMRKKDPSD